ncbi:MAG: AAA family ATPase [Spirochaetes bacterium]|nr:AAA family ATPase [Spirochaetota bacterium]
MNVLLIIAGVVFVIWLIAKSVADRKLPAKTDSSRPVIPHPQPAPVRSERAQKTLGPQPIRLEDIQLDDPIFRSALEAMEAGESAFITGRAGTGKSTLLRYFKDTTHRSVVVLAPTGVAALNIGGQTIHSFFRLPPRDFLDPDDMQPPRGQSVLLMRKLQTLVIDEVSMVRADMLECIDRKLRMARSRSHEPFGGVQMVLIGDPFQLPPVVQDATVREHFQELYGGPYFFKSPALKEANLRLIELQKNYRQSDPRFIDLLNRVRENNLDPASIEILNGRVQSRERAFNGEPYITATPTNAIAQQINTTYLNALPGQEVTLHGDFAGELTPIMNGLPAKLPTDDPLVLKDGAQVMLVRNDVQRRWVNGTLGTLSGDPRRSIAVNLGGATYQVDKCTWEKIEYAYDTIEEKIVPKVVGTFTQYPLKLGWAFTIHKVQGLTLDRLYLDLAGGAFAHGQTYTALSRCRSLDGLALGRAVYPADIILDAGILAFREAFRS